MKIHIEMMKNRMIRYSTAYEISSDREVIAVCWSKNCAERVKKALEAIE